MILDANGTPIADERELAIGYGRASVMESLGMDFQNPDAIAREKGLEYYDEVARDPHVKAVWGTRIMALVGCQREFFAASDSAIDQAALALVQWNFSDYLKRRSLDTIVEQTFRSGTKNGFTVQEVIWNPRHPRGTVIEDIKDRDPERFIIKNDGIYLKRHVWDIDGEKQPPRKFMTQAFEPEYENPYGTSLMQTIHWYVWFKKSGMKFWLLFLEKFGMPTVVAKIPEGFSDDKELRRVRDVLNSIQQKTNITVPAGFEISLLEAAKSGAGAGYDILCDKCDAQISKAILGQTLTTQEGKDSGSYALGKVHAEVKADILIADGKWIDTLLNWQAVVWLIDFNFKVQAYPYMVTQTQPGDDLRAECEIDEKLVNMGVRLTQKYFYEKYNRPEPQAGEAVVSPQTPPLTPPQQGGEQTPLAFGEGQGVRFFSETSPRERIAPTDALFEAVKKSGAKLYQAAFVAPYKRLAAWANNYPSFQAGLDRLERDTDAFQTHLADALVTANILGRWVMMQRINPPSPSERGQGVRYFAEGEPEDEPFLDVEILLDALTPEEAAKFIAEKRMMGASAYKALSDEAKRTAFAISGIEDKRVTELVREELETAIREGKTYDDFKAAVEQIFDDYGVTEFADFHLETLFRTNVQSAYNQGAYELLHDPDVADMIAYLVYDSIEDSRTCALCAALDGTTLPMDDPFWSAFWPPNHHRCRCDVRPVTQASAKRDGVTPKAAPKTAKVTWELKNGQKRTKIIDVYPADGFATGPNMGGQTK